MAKKIKLTRPELKRYRDALSRFERYLPMLKLKQQQLQLTLRNVDLRRRAAQQAVQAAQARFDAYAPVLLDRAGIDLSMLSQPLEVKSRTESIAGVAIPIFEGVTFAPADYSLFSTPPWVDRALADLREISRLKSEKDILDQEHLMLSRELTKIIQRVNLFEKIKIPESREAIRRIRIQLGDEMTAGVGRAKIAKGKLAEAESPVDVEPAATQETL